MEEKSKKFGKGVIWTVASYVVISVIAGICWVAYGFGRGAGSAKVSGEAIVMLIVMPVLFLVAGLIGTRMFRLEKLKAHKVWLFSIVFSLFLLLLWYVLDGVYVVLNLPTGVGSYALDVALRKTIIVDEYEVKYWANTNTYKYVVLPLIHFLFRVIYWLFYLWGNRIGVSSEKKQK